MAVDTEQQTTPEDAFAKVLGRDPFSKKAKTATPVKPVQELDSGSPESQFEKVLGRKAFETKTSVSPELSRLITPLKQSEAMGPPPDLDSWKYASPATVERVAKKPSHEAEAEPLGSFWNLVNTPIGDLGNHPERTQEFYTRAMSGYTSDQIEEAIQDKDTQSGLTEANKFWLGFFGSKDKSLAKVMAAFTTPLSVATLGFGGVYKLLTAGEAVQAATLADSLNTLETARVSGNAEFLESSLNEVMAVRAATETAEKMSRAAKGAALATSGAFTAGATADAIQAATRLKQAQTHDEKVRATSDLMEAGGMGLMMAAGTASEFLGEQPPGVEKPKATEWLSKADDQIRQAEAALAKAQRDKRLGGSEYIVKGGGVRDVGKPATPKTTPVRELLEPPTSEAAFMVPPRLEAPPEVPKAEAQAGPVKRSEAGKPSSVTPPPEAPVEAPKAEGGATIQSIEAIHDPALADVDAKVKGRAKEMEQKYPITSPGLTKEPFAPPPEPLKKHKFGNTQTNIPDSSEAAQALNGTRSRISDSDLAGQGKDIEGNHVTVRYGIDSNNTAGIKEFLSKQGPFEATLGKTDKFPPSESSDGAAVIIAPVNAPELHRLNSELAKHGDFIDPTFDYKPHATVAYVKPESADRYVGMNSTDGKKFLVDTVTLSNRDGSQEVVKLGGTPRTKPEPVTPAKPGQVAELPVDQIVADPSRFQFRYALSDSGLFDRLEAGEAFKYDPKLAGILAVWTDPADGFTYVINGHHRLELAKRTGQTHVLTRSLDAATAEEARAQGALINIAEGHATEVDAAKFFRDSGMTAEDLKEQGISLGTRTARGGLALSKLSEPIFEKVVRGEIPEKRGIVIGEELSDPTEQAAILQLIDKKGKQGTKLSDDEVRELARFVKDAGTTTQSVDTLFGEEQIQHSNAIEKAQLSSWVKKQLAQDKKLFGFVAKAERAKELSRAGNIIDVDKSSEIAQSSKIAEEVYNRLIRRFGPVSDAIDEGAVRLVKGEEPNVVRKDIYRKVREAVAEVLPGTKAEGIGGIEASPSPGGTTGTGEQFVEPPEWGLDLLLGRETGPELGPAPPGAPPDLGSMEPPPSLFDAIETKPLLRVDRPSGLTEPELQVPGPGAKNVRTVKETPSDIIQLRDSLAAVTYENQSMQDRMHTASRLASTLSKGGDLLTDYWNRVKTNFAAMWNAYTRPHPWTDFKHMLGEWQYADQRAEHEAYLFAQEVIKQVPDKMKRQAIVNYIEAEGDRDTLLARAFASKDKWKDGYLEATTLSESEKILASNIQNYFESRLQAAIDGGILDHGVENYVHRIVKHPDKSGVVRKLLGEVAMGKLQTNPRFAKKRLFETSFDVEQAGMEHVNKDVGFLITAYDLSFNRALSARAFVKSLLSGQASDGRPLVSVTGSGVRINDAEAGPKAYIIKPNTLPHETGDYKSIDHPALRKWKWAAQDAQGAPVFVQGDLAVHPEAYQHLKNVLSRSALQAHPIGRAVLKAQGTLKSTMLSASLFHQEQIGTHAVGHWVNPTDVPEINWDDSRQQGLIKGGLQVVNHHALEEFSEGVAGAGLIKYVPVIGPKFSDYQEYLFGDYIPRLKMKMAMAALERNRERYPELSGDQLNELTANQANAAFGELNYKMLGRNPTFQDAMRLVLLAPDFLEARGRFAGQALKPYGREQAVALMRIGGIVYGGARVMNMAFNDGDPKWDKPFSVVIGGHEFSIRSIPGDIYHLATNPRSFFLWRLNPFITRPAIELMYGRDAYGRKQTAYDQGVDYLKGVLPITVQKWPEHVYQLAKDELERKDTGPDLTETEKDFLDGLLNSIGVRESVYRSPAADLAHKKMVDTLPANMSKEILDHSRKLHDYEMELKAGGLGFDRMQELVKSGDLTQKDIKIILSPKGQYDDLQRSLTHLSAKDGMEVWKLANKQERVELANQMVSKVKRSKSMTAQEKSAALDELIRDINASETMSPPPPYNSGLEEPPPAP